MLDENEVAKLDYKNEIVETIVQLLNEIVDLKQEKIFILVLIFTFPMTCLIYRLTLVRHFSFNNL